MDSNGQESRHLSVVGARASNEEVSDDDLMRLVKSGHEAAFATLVRRHQDLVLGLAVRFVGDRALGRDIAQDVFLTLWAERARYRARGRFRSYLVAVTLNRCRVVVRQRRSHGRKMENLAQESRAGGRAEGTDGRPLAELVAAERAREVRERLLDLPEKPRQVLILRFTHELPLEEIAALLDMPVGTVKSHVSRGLKRLRKLLSGGGR